MGKAQGMAWRAHDVVCVVAATYIISCTLWVDGVSVEENVAALATFTPTGFVPNLIDKGEVEKVKAKPAAKAKAAENPLLKFGKEQMANQVKAKVAQAQEKDSKRVAIEKKKALHAKQEQQAEKAKAKAAMHKAKVAKHEVKAMKMEVDEAKAPKQTEQKHLNAEKSTSFMKQQAKAAEMAAEHVARKEVHLTHLASKEVASKRRDQEKVASTYVQAQEEVKGEVEPTPTKAHGWRAIRDSAPPPLHGLNDRVKHLNKAAEVAKQEMKKPAPFHYDLMEAEAQAEKKQAAAPHNAPIAKKHPHKKAHAGHKSQQHAAPKHKITAKPAKKGVSCFLAGECNPKVCLCKAGQPPVPLKKPAEPTLKESNDHLKRMLRKAKGLQNAMEHAHKEAGTMLKEQHGGFTLPTDSHKLTPLEKSLIMKMAKQIQHNDSKGSDSKGSDSKSKPAKKEHKKSRADSDEKLPKAYTGGLLCKECKRGKKAAKKKAAKKKAAKKKAAKKAAKKKAAKKKATKKAAKKKAAKKKAKAAKKKSTKKKAAKKKATKKAAKKKAAKKKATKKNAAKKAAKKKAATKKATKKGKKRRKKKKAPPKLVKKLVQTVENMKALHSNIHYRLKKIAENQRNRKNKAKMPKGGRAKGKRDGKAKIRKIIKKAKGQQKRKDVTMVTNKVKQAVKKVKSAVESAVKKAKEIARKRQRGIEEKDRKKKRKERDWKSQKEKIRKKVKKEVQAEKKKLSVKPKVKHLSSATLVTISQNARDATRVAQRHMGLGGSRRRGLQGMHLPQPNPAGGAAARARRATAQAQQNRAFQKAGNGM